MHCSRSYFNTENGLRLSYISQTLTCHSGIREAVVLLHSVATNANYWLCLMNRLAPKFDVYALDFPNSGQSQTTIPANLTLPNLTSYVGEFLTHLGLARAYFVGHGIGAITALNFSIISPQRVIKIVTASANPRSLPTTPPAAPWDYPIDPDLIFLLSLALSPDADIPTLAPVIAAAVDPINCSAVQKLVPQYIRSVEEYRAYLQALLGTDFRDQVSLVTVPVLVTAGALDPYTPPGAAQFMYANIPNAVFTEFADQGYNYPIFASTTFNQVVYNYLCGTCDPCVPYIDSVQDKVPLICGGTAYERYIEQISTIRRRC